MSLLLLLAGAAWPCAGIFHGDGALAESGVQEVLLRAGESTVTASYRVTYEGDAASFGWVIPVPGAFVSLSDGEDRVFEDLESLTAPIVDYIEEEGADDGGCGCGAKDNALRGGGLGETAGTDSGLEIIAEGFSGTYAYTVLEATSAEPLLAWLEENGWEAGNSQTSIESYVSDGGFQFVAISLAPDDPVTYDGGRNLPPVDIVYEGTTLSYPARMGRYAMEDALRTTVWIEAAHQASVSGWSSQTLGTITHEPDLSAEAIFRSALADLSATSPTYNLSWSGNGDSGWVTRFDTYTPAELHTVDAVFTVGTTDEEVQTVLRIGYVEGAAAWLLLPLLGLGVGLRRR